MTALMKEMRSVRCCAVREIAPTYAITTALVLANRPVSVLHAVAAVALWRMHACIHVGVDEMGRGRLAESARVEVALDVTCVS